MTAGDPVEAGFVTSLAQPGGNITGLAGLGAELSGKRLEILTQAVPQLSRGPPPEPHQCQCGLCA